MNTILKKHYITISISVIICILAIGFIGIIFSKMNVRINETTSLKEQLLSYQLNKKAFNDENAQVGSLQERLAKLESFLINNGSVPGLLSKLEALAEKNGNEFEITSVQTPISGDGTKLVIECTTRGSYKQVISFFEAIQKQDFQVRLSKFFIFSEQKDTASPETAGTLLVTKNKKTAVTKEIEWQGVATLEIVSFK